MNISWPLTQKEWLKAVEIGISHGKAYENEIDGYIVFTFNLDMQNVDTNLTFDAFRFITLFQSKQT